MPLHPVGVEHHFLSRFMNDTLKTSVFARATEIAKTSTQAIVQVLWEDMFRSGVDHSSIAHKLQKSLGHLKGPIMKIAQMLGNIPGAVPEAYRSVFKDLQAEAPPMGPLFVKRRMRQELGEGYQNYFQNFDECAFKAASLGQVHKGILKTGEHVVCKLQYPDMFRTVSSDLSQFRF